MNKIILEFTLEETNALLNALAQLPFIQSVNLINNIQTQATPQVIGMESTKDEPKTAS